MTRTAPLGLAAALLLAVAPAAAQDLRIALGSEASPLLADANGSPWWREMARCTGFLLSAAETYGARGDAGQAVRTQQAAEQLHDQALRRLALDRRIEEQAAAGLLKPEVRVGLRLADTTVGKGTGARSAWNVYRSRCLDLREAYGAQAYAAR